MMYLWIGIGLGVLATIPLVLLAMRRTERRVRLLEQRARVAERLAEIGTLTGGLAHEIKNPLSTIGLNAQLIQEDLAELARTVAAAAGESGGELGGSSGGNSGGAQFQRIARRFESLNREAQRLRDILEDFLRFAGRVKLDLAPTDVAALLGELADFFAPQAQAAGVRIRTQLVADAASVPADAALLKQALLNLLINATQAMAAARAEGLPNGGANELLLRTETVRVLKQTELRIHVTDTGPGIAADKIDKIFQPYFSTRRGGTGLGLPTARRIIDEHGGTLTVHSEVGKGTDFVIALPMEEGEGATGG